MNNRPRRTEKVTDPDTVNALISMNDRLANVRNILSRVYDVMPDDLSGGALYGMICALEGISRDLHTVTDGMGV